MTGFGKNQKGQILYRTGTVSIGAAISQNVITKLADLCLLGDDFRVLKVDYYCVIDEIPEEDYADGLMVFGFADNELSTQEIQDCIQSTPGDRNDHLALEQSHRPVWPQGFMKPTPLSDADSQGCVFIEGTWKPRWTFSDTEGFCGWLYHMANNAGADATPVFRYMLKIYGVWVT